MSCHNCSNLKMRAFNYQELLRKWEDIYTNAPITEGYEKRLRREAIKFGVPFEKIKLRFVYCSQGILQRFYVVRSKTFIKAKSVLGNCRFYA